MPNPIPPTQTNPGGAGTKQYPIAPNAADVWIAADPDRRSLFIKNYTNDPANQANPQTAIMYVLFQTGGTATAGTKGELELMPGEYFVFGGPLPPKNTILPKGFSLPNVPLEEVHIFASTLAKGCIIVQC